MLKFKAIHQYTPSVAFGDSVSNGLIFTQKLLHSMGFESEIYICDTSVDIKFSHQLFHLDQYIESADQLLLYHHSIGHVCHDKIMNFLDKKILVYHNITPSHFFKNEKHLQMACDEGREQLKNSVSHFIGSFADSTYNCNELRYYNYKNPVSLPLLIDLDKETSIIANESIVEKYVDSYNILFVGRVVQNKSQHQLIDVMFQLKQKQVENVKLFIVGGISQLEYFHYLHQYAKNLEVNVVITNKVSNEDLKAYYKLADLYLSLSEHEGFGMPLIEAIRYDIPVLAYNVGGVSTAVVKEGLLEKKAPSFVADEIIKLQKNPYFRVKLLKIQKKHLEDFSYNNRRNKFIDYLSSLNIKTPNKILDMPSKKITYQVEGPFDSTYSLAIVNKDIALGLDKQKDIDVKLYSTEGYGDFEPNLENLDKTTKELSSKTIDNIDITIRNLYPPRTNAMKGYHKIIGPYGWEESKFPSNFVDGFNKKTTLIFSMSEYVKNLLKHNGVYTPIVTTGLIVEDILHYDSEPLAFELPRNFKLLHISSSFPRKGIDKLLEAFNILDTTLDISLIIKTFPNPHNQTISQLDAKGYKQIKKYEDSVSLYTKDKKQILLINKDINKEQIKYLYENSNILLAPSFGEGFGLPLAEAMLLELPVITTGFGGQTDFCTNETSWLLDFDFELALTHMKLSSSIWAVPRISAIRDTIEHVYHLQETQVKTRTLKAKAYILNNYSSKNVLAKIQNTIKDYPSKKPTRNIALVSTYNTRCGIAFYAKQLISSFSDEVVIFANQTKDKPISKDESNIIRCWNDGRDTKEITLLKEQLVKHCITKLIIQYNFSFLPLRLLEELLNFCDEKNIQTYLYLHSTKDVIQPTYKDSLITIKSSLQKAKKIYIHTLDDMNYIKNFGIYKNTYLATHGTEYIIPKTYKKNVYPTLATFGFLLPQKGVFLLLKVLEDLHAKGIKARLLYLTSIHPAPISTILANQLKQKIKESNLSEYITLNTDFLGEQEIVDRLSQADKILFLYGKTQESSSAAVRIGLLSQKEIITTPVTIFEDVKSVVTTTKDDKLETISNTVVNSLSKVYDNSKQVKWCEDNSWKQISENLYNLL